MPELDAAAAALLERHGLASIPGGRHPGRGTANRIVPLGDSYLELITVADAAQAAHDVLGSGVAAAITHGPALFAWCVAVDSIEAVAKHLNTSVEPGSRVRPDGVEVRWQMTGLERALADSSRPFFIDWEVPPEVHPGHAEAKHRRMPRGIAWVEIAGELDGWLDETQLRVRTAQAGHGLEKVAIRTDQGEVLLQTGAV